MEIFHGEMLGLGKEWFFAIDFSSSPTEKFEFIKLIKWLYKWLSYEQEANYSLSFNGLGPASTMAVIRNLKKRNADY